jgi:hypothetical protein
MGWDNIRATWSKTGNLVTIGLPPDGSDNWVVRPDSVGTGLIIASGTGAVSDTVVAIFLAGSCRIDANLQQRGKSIRTHPLYPSRR